MNTRKTPFNKLAVRQARQLRDRPRGAGQDLRRAGHARPRTSCRRARRGVQEAQRSTRTTSPRPRRSSSRLRHRRAAVAVWGHTTDPTPKAAQYLASVLNQLGYKATVKTLDESVYWDTIATQKGDPQIGVPAAGTRTTPRARTSSTCCSTASTSPTSATTTLEHQRAGAKQADQPGQAMPLGAARNAIWAKLDELYMKNDAGWVPFMNRQCPSTSRATCTVSCSTAPTSSCSRRCV